MASDLPETVKAILITVQEPGTGESTCREHLEELKGLVRTLEFEILDAKIVRIPTPRPR